MAIFAVIAPEKRADLAEAMTRAFGDDAFEYAPGQFVVTSSGLTTQGVTDKIGASTGQHGQVVVFAVTGWWGYHNRALWEWLTVRQSAAA